MSGDIRYFKLKNSGAFISRMKIEWTHMDGSHESRGTYEPNGYHDICAGAERTIDMNEAGIPNNSTVKLKAVVVGGKDKTSESYAYAATNSDTASYEISGTTLINKLEKI